MSDSDQYFKATTISALQAGFYTLDAQSNWQPNAGLNITPITQATTGKGDGTSYYINIRTSTILSTPTGCTAVTGQEAIPVTGEWQ